MPSAKDERRTPAHRIPSHSCVNGPDTMHIRPHRSICFFPDAPWAPSSLSAPTGTYVPRKVEPIECLNSWYVVLKRGWTAGARCRETVESQPSSQMWESGRHDSI